MSKKASVRGKGASILLGGEEGGEPLPMPLSELEGDLEPGGDGVAEAGEHHEAEAVDWSAMEEDEIATAAPADAETGETSGSPLPAIEHYFPQEGLSASELEQPMDEDMASEVPTAVVNPVAPATPVTPEMPKPAAPPISEGEEVDWSPLMEDEASTAESPKGMISPPIEHYYPPEELMLPKAELETVEPSKAAVSPSTPAVEPTGPPVSPAAGQPPATVTTAPQIRLGGLLAGTDLSKVAPPPGPVIDYGPVRESDRPPAQELSEEEEEIVIGRVSQKHRRELYAHITSLYQQVPTKLSASRQQSKMEEALLLLSEARDIVIEEPRQFDEAEHKVAQVEAIIANAQDVEKWSHYYGNRLIVYLVTWFTVLMAGIVIVNTGLLTSWLEGMTSTLTLAEGIRPLTIEPLLFSMMWGGVGGVVGGIYSLWRYIASFDKQYTIWYTLQPIGGLVVGGVIHVLTMTGFLSLSVQTGGAGTTPGQASQIGEWFPALLAVAFGFRQNNFWGLLDRIIELIGHPQGGDGEDEDNQ
ncbi:MAG: hypothetical protein ACOYZ7_07820 [Chloroflexota bacterium]